MFKIKQTRHVISASDGTLIEAIPQLVWTARPDGWHEYVNQRWCDYTGLTLEQAQCIWAHFQFIHPDDQESNRAHWQHALDTGAPFEHEERLKHSQTGEYRWFLTRAMPMRDETGQIVTLFGTCTDIDEQKQAEEALRPRLERESLLMNSSIIGVFLAEDGQIVEANDTFLRMTGYNREDLHGQRVNWTSITLPSSTSLSQQVHQELLIQQGTTPIETELLCKDGSPLPVLLGGIAFHGQVRHGIGFVLDNSARKELERRKEDFVSMASHELKTPLTALKLQTQMLRKRLDRHGLHELAATFSRVEEPFRRLERLVGELLDVSKIQAGRLEYRQEPVDLNRALRQVADTIQQMSPTHRIVIQGTAPCRITGDTGRLEQIFVNLFSNAIKYAPDARLIEVEVSNSSEAVTISVRDHGIGIPREQHEKIFERFYRAFDPSQRAVPGLGMGLYIVAEIVKQHGGTISVESEVGKGSTFHVRLPLKRHASSL